MRVNARAVLEDCLEKAVMHAVRNIDDALTDTQVRQLERKLEQELWLQIDTYFNFPADGEPFWH
jgi:phosphatidate phosphatase APP1